MIYPPTGAMSGYVISSRRCWLPGSYATRQAAKYAFQFSDSELFNLRNRVNVEEKRLITTDDLRAARKK